MQWKANFIGEERKDDARCLTRILQRTNHTDLLSIDYNLDKRSFEFALNTLKHVKIGGIRIYSSCTLDIRWKNSWRYFWNTISGTSLRKSYWNITFAVFNCSHGRCSILTNGVKIWKKLIYFSIFKIHFLGDFIRCIAEITPIVCVDFTYWSLTKIIPEELKLQWNKFALDLIHSTTVEKVVITINSRVSTAHSVSYYREQSLIFMDLFASYF